MSLKQILLETFTSPIVHGGVSAVALKMMFSDKNSLPLLGKDVSVQMAGFILGASASFASEIVTNFLLPEVQKNERLQMLESSLIKIGTSAGIFLALPFFLNGFKFPDMNTALKFASVGALSEVVASYTYEHYVNNMIFSSQSELNFY